MIKKMNIFERLGLIEKKDTDKAEKLAGDDLIGTSENSATLNEKDAEVSKKLDTFISEKNTSIHNDVLNASSDNGFKNPENSVKPIKLKANKSGKINDFLSSNTSDPSMENQSLTKGEKLGKDLLSSDAKEMDINRANTHQTLQATDDVEKKLDLMIESYERNKLLSIEDIYQKNTLMQDVKSTVFMVDVYAKALPENLPLDIKRESVLNIMKASDIEVNSLLNDAYMRIDALNKVLEDVVQTTGQLKQKNDASIRDLENRIKEIKKTMQEREKFQETQNTMIEYEIQRIINIVDFVKPK